MNDRPENQPNAELDLDALESVTGGTGPNSGNGGVDGTVVVALGNSMFGVDVGGQTITAHLSGKLRMNFIRVQVGDRVRVEGNRITYRYK